MFEQVFHKGQEIEVIVEENIDNRISLTWDKTLEQNQKLCNEIYDKFKTLSYPLFFSVILCIFSFSCALLIIILDRKADL